MHIAIHPSETIWSIGGTRGKKKLVHSIVDPFLFKRLFGTISPSLDRLLGDLQCSLFLNFLANSTEEWFSFFRIISRPFNHRHFLTFHTNRQRSIRIEPTMCFDCFFFVSPRICGRAFTRPMPNTARKFTYIFTVFPHNKSCFFF